MLCSSMGSLKNFLLFFLLQVEVSPPEVLQHYTMILQRIRSLWEMMDSNPGPLPPEVWCTNNDPPHLFKFLYRGFVTFPVLLLFNLYLSISLSLSLSLSLYLCIAVVSYNPQRIFYWSPPIVRPPTIIFSRGPFQFKLWASIFKMAPKKH